MGAINYFTSDYITMGIKPYSTEDFTGDQDFLEFLKTERGLDISDENAVISAAYDEINDCYECDRMNIETELKAHSFYYYHITIKPGYYEGFTLDIENNFGVAYDDYTDRRAAQKEITEIKQFLIACAGMGLVSVAPGWCTGYKDYKGTLAAINDAIKEMRAEAAIIPTWRQYEKEAAL